MQLQYEGRIVAKAGFNWTAAVENARLRWIQLNKIRERDLLKDGSDLLKDGSGLLKDGLLKDGSDLLRDGSKVKKFIKSCIDEQFQQLEMKLEKKLDEKLAKYAEHITEAVVQSLKSAEDVNQRVISRFKKRKKNNSVIGSRED